MKSLNLVSLSSLFLLSTFYYFNVYLSSLNYNLISIVSMYTIAIHLIVIKMYLVKTNNSNIHSFLLKLHINYIYLYLITSNVILLFYSFTKLISDILIFLFFINLILIIINVSFGLMLNNDET